tara:strand:+ start:1214 stop:1750 length:537 start_codon:yes stop_codon:yes gene_type:complete
MSEMKHIILDRDGVINHDSSEHIRNADEWVPIEGSLEAIRLLTESNFKIYIATNQSGINRGIINYANFIEINIKMMNLINHSGGEIAAIAYCPYTAEENSPLRKPNNGMYVNLAKRFNFDLHECYSIGDSPRDIEASIKSGCKTLGVKTGNGRDILKNNIHKVKIFDNLLKAVKNILP